MRRSGTRGKAPEPAQHQPGRREGPGGTARRRRSVRGERAGRLSRASRRRAQQALMQSQRRSVLAETGRPPRCVVEIGSVRSAQRCDTYITPGNLGIWSSGADALARRPELAAALADARKVKCPVTVAKLDRP